MKTYNDIILEPVNLIHLHAALLHVDEDFSKINVIKILFSECLLNRNIDNKHLKRGKSRSLMSTPEKHVRNGNGHHVMFVNGSCDNLSNNNKYYDQDRSLKFLEKHKIVLMGKFSHNICTI